MPDPRLRSTTDHRNTTLDIDSNEHISPDNIANSDAAIRSIIGSTSRTENGCPVWVCFPCTRIYTMTRKQDRSEARASWRLGTDLTCGSQDGGWYLDLGPTMNQNVVIPELGP